MMDQMSLLALALTTTLAGAPVLWLDPRGSLLVDGVPVRGRMTPGAEMVRTPLGLGLDLSGRRGGLLLGDLPALKLTGSLTISTWIYLRSHVSAGSAGQILFRGDDRNANDPYHLTILPTGMVQFGIDSADGSRPGVETEIPTKRWVHVTATFDAEEQELRLWLGDRLKATRATEKLPISGLDGKFAPGIGIGNVQNDRGPHNHPLDGLLVDLRLYASAIKPGEAGYRAGLDLKNP